MASEIHSIWDSQQVLASSHTINAGEKIEILNSGDLSNDSGTIYNSVRVEIEYNNLSPNIGSFSIGAIVEGKNANNNYFPLAYQFSDLRSSGQASKRIILLQPNMDTFNVGIDDLVFVAGEEEARISREQGTLPESKFRVRVLLVDNDPSGAGAFVSVDISATYELYNA